MARHATRQFAPELLKAAQREVAIGNEDLARQIGVTLRVVQKWRAGLTTPSGANLLGLAAALGRRPEDFYAEVEPEPRAVA